MKLSSPLSATTGPEPPPLWQTRATDFARTCQDRLDHKSNIMAWLLDRGLTIATIRYSGLGWNPEDTFVERDAWGLPNEVSAQNGRREKLYLPAGLTIPLYPEKSGLVTRLRVRLSNPRGDHRYVAIGGSSMAPLTLWQDQLAVVVVESELDGWLLDQEVSNMAGIIALGPPVQRPDPVLHERLLAIKSILIALDDNAAGNVAAEYWLKIYPNARRWKPGPGKDPGEMHQAGQSVRAWIEAGLNS
jgi:hypothetical protein